VTIPFVGMLTLALLILTGQPATSGEFAASGMASAPGLTGGTQAVAAATTEAGRKKDGHFGPAWTTRIQDRPVLTKRSQRMVRHLAADGRAYANLYDYGVPVYRVTDSTRHRRVTCTKPWGRCDLERQPVPIPAAAQPNLGSDGAMVLVHRGRGKVYEFWQARKRTSGWRTSWGTISRLSGDGSRGATGSGISRLAGIVRVKEMAARNIPHALVFSTNSACENRYRYPATKTDGTYDRRGCIPEGARVQLDPAIDLDSIRMARGERVVARALQRYGAYVVDVGAERMAFGFEKPTSTADPYPKAGLAWDYFAMERIPWESLRVLRRWDGS